MPERVVKNKRISKCRYCSRDITTPHKIKFKYDEREKRGTYYHLSCYYKNLLRSIELRKSELSKFRKAKNKLKKYKKDMILENL